MVTQVEPKPDHLGAVDPAWGGTINAGIFDVLHLLNRGGVSTSEYVQQATAALAQSWSQGTTYAEVAIFGGIALAVIGLVRN